MMNEVEMKAYSDYVERSLQPCWWAQTLKDHPSFSNVLVAVSAWLPLLIQCS